jgi:SAM-dependent methyltransferase
MDENGIREELFCLSFELRTLSGFVNKGEMERWVPGFSPQQVEREHIARYSWATQFVGGKKVLDIACGVGFGSYLIAEKGNAQRVLACDIHPESIRYGSWRYRHPKVDFAARDAIANFPPNIFDVIISFETIEHLPNAMKFLENVRDALSETGRFWVSTPLSAKKIDEGPPNPFHRIEWGFEEFQRFVAEVFFIENIYIQLSRIEENGFEKGSRKIKGLIGGRAEKQKPVINPAVWDPAKTPAEKIGRKYHGYQILQCRKTKGEFLGKERE